MQFLIRSPLSPDECHRRLMLSVEGPIGSMKATVPEWHVLGQMTAGHLSATVVGLRVGPDGRRILASRRALGAELKHGDNGTVIAGEIMPRFPTKRQAFVARYLMPPMLVLTALFALVVPSERLLMIGVIVLCLAMLFGARSQPLASRGCSPRRRRLLREPSSRPECR
jgi:hypothetical protein